MELPQRRKLDVRTTFLFRDCADRSRVVRAHGPRQMAADCSLYTLTAAGQSSRMRGSAPAPCGQFSEADFLWLLSSDFFLSPLPQLVPRHRRQVMLLVIRDVAVAPHAGVLQPPWAPPPQGRMMIVTPRPPAGVGRPGPFPLPHREEYAPIDDVAPRLRTSESRP